MSEEEIIEKCKIKKKPLELLHTIAFNIELMGITCFGDEFREIEKALKTLEIIFKKGIDIGWLRQCKKVEEYNYHCEAKHLTQEEFDLLKRYSNEKI